MPSNDLFINKNVLDAGCGGGRYSYAISRMGAKKVTGIDFGDEGLKFARQNYGKTKNLNFKKGNVLNIPFKDNSFDTVFSNGVIHHTTNIKKHKKNGYVTLSFTGPETNILEIEKLHNLLI